MLRFSIVKGGAGPAEVRPYTSIYPPRRNVPMSAFDPLQTFQDAVQPTERTPRLFVMRFVLLTLLAVSACTPAGVTELPPVASGPTDYVENLPSGFSAQKIKTDLEGAIVERFGSAALQRALSAESYVLSRHYQGLAPPPPVPGEAPPLPAAAVLILERGVWYQGETGGNFRSLAPAQQQQWLAALADAGPWAEPTFAYPTCTDAGATYLIASLPNRPFLLRAANCATPKSERLGLAAINL